MGVMDFPDYARSGGVLPKHPSNSDLIAEVIDSLRPPTRMTVDRAAEMHRKTRVGMQWQDWSNTVAPYLIEPQRMITSRRYGVVCFVGPAQSLKTSALIENPIVHAIMCQPRTVHVIQMDRTAAHQFSIEKIGPMIRHSPDLASRQLAGRSADNIESKMFRGGMYLTIGWPVVSQLSSRAIPLVLLTDYDRYKENISGEGSALQLARNRPKTFGSLGKVVLECSPGRPITKENWKPETPHEAPPTTGALEVYNTGTRGRLYWHCPDCPGQFEPRLDRLEWPEDCASPGEAGRRTVMICPHCGSIIEPRWKHDLNLGSIWLHEAADGSLVEIGDPAVRETDTVSYWMQGPAAALSKWSDIVTMYLTAHETLKRTGDEQSLMTVLNTQFGMPYLPRGMAAESDISAEALLERAERRALRIAPAGTRFVTVAVDVQATRFVVQVDAWGPDRERWLIDRFDIHDAPEGAPGAGKRTINPPRYAEDWARLDELMDLVYPVQGAGYGLKPAVIAVDSQGAPGTTDNAYRFWRRMRKLGHHRVWHLVRQHSGFASDIAWIARPKSASKQASKHRQVASDIPFLHLSVDRLKDATIAQLGREADGAGAYHLSSMLPPEVFEEFCSENRTPKGWEKKRGVVRNEAFDLGGYSLGLALILRADRINWDDPPAWAALGPQNQNAVDLSQAETPREEQRQEQKPEPRQRSGGGYIGARPDWLSGRGRWTL